MSSKGPAWSCVVDASQTVGRVALCGVAVYAYVYIEGFEPQILVHMVNPASMFEGNDAGGVIDDCDFA